jgi:Restriction endonuclease NotI
MKSVTEVFGKSTENHSAEWLLTVEQQLCPYVNKKCFKTRKSQPDISFGTCSVRTTTNQNPLIICPNRFLESNKIFIDCLHLLTLHEPGNEVHVVSEINMLVVALTMLLYRLGGGK